MVPTQPFAGAHVLVQPAPGKGGPCPGSTSLGEGAALGDLLVDAKHFLGLRLDRPLACQAA